MSPFFSTVLALEGELKPRRKTEGFNLAFLDIMSCGLGAIVLVFMLVKFNSENSVLEIDLLKKDIQRLEDKKKSLLEKVTKEERRKAAILTRIEETSIAVEKSRAAIMKSKSVIASQENQKLILKNSIKAIEIPKNIKIAEETEVGQVDHIIGLRVKGRKIVILVDSSSSMTDERLVDVIRRKNTDTLNKKAGPKWQRTKKIVKWLLARAPQKSDVSVIAFNNAASQLGGKGWKSGGDALALERVLKDLDLIVPEGSTNLQEGLQKIAALKPTDIYLISDGLPTNGSDGYKSLNPFAKCSSLWGIASTISGDCRVKLFQHTVSSTKLSGATVNVILLPIEGDPQASNEFWKWTSLTKGILINPAASWP